MRLCLFNLKILIHIIPSKDKTFSRIRLVMRVREGSVFYSTPQTQSARARPMQSVQLQVLT